jgi:hypothetical protein
MSTRSRYLNGNLEWYESATAERVLRATPVAFNEDFLGKTFDTTNIWTARDTNSATEAVVADAPNGVLGLTLTAANEIQLAGVDWGDQRTLVLNQSLIFESRFRFQTLPTGSVVACVGLCGDFNAAVNTVAESIWFRADGSGAITVETDDTVHETSLISTGITVTTADWIIVQIDCTDITSVKFYINGNRVASATTFNMSQVAALALQLVARIGKEGAAATVGTLEVDYLRAWQERTA